MVTMYTYRKTIITGVWGSSFLFLEADAVSTTNAVLVAEEEDTLAKMDDVPLPSRRSSLSVISRSIVALLQIGLPDDKGS